MRDFIFSRYNVDTYCHCWYSEKIDSFQGSDWHENPTKYYVGGNFYRTENTINIINKIYSPVSSIFEEPKDFTNMLNEEQLNILKNKRTNRSGENYFSLRNVNNLLSHLYSIEKSLSLVDVSQDYDFVILTRYDALILMLTDINLLDKGYIYVSNQHGKCGDEFCFVDNIFVIDSLLIDGLKCFSNIENLIDSIDMWTAECVKKNNILKYFGENKIRYTDLLVGVARNNTDVIGQAN
jgi:hypothetical protein